MLISAAIVAWLRVDVCRVFLRRTPRRRPRSATPPDFSGVYTRRNEGRGGAGRRGAPPPPGGAQRGGPPPRPTQSAPLSDGSQGRAPDAPKLTPEYLAKWK